MTTGYLPNVMKMGVIENDITTTDDFDTSTLEIDSSGNIYTTVKVIDEEDTEHTIQITNVVSATQIKIKSNTDLSKDIFVYGQEVDNKLGINIYYCRICFTGSR